MRELPLHSSRHQNARLDAPTARGAGLVHQLCEGIITTQTHALEVARLAAGSVDPIKALRCQRAQIDRAVLAREAIGHAECQATNGGFSKSLLPVHTLVRGTCVERPLAGSGSWAWDCPPPSSAPRWTRSDWRS